MTKKKTQKELNYIQKTKNPMRSSNGPQTENGREKNKNLVKQVIRLKSENTSFKMQKQRLKKTEMQ